MKITRDQVLQAQREHPTFNKYQLADLLGCSEQTIDRRLNNNNVREASTPSSERSSWSGVW